MLEVKLKSRPQSPFLAKHRKERSSDQPGARPFTTGRQHVIGSKNAEDKLYAMPTHASLR